MGNLMFNFLDVISRNNLRVTYRRSKNVCSGKHNSGKTVPQNLRGLPDRGELD